jgi:hypothetical protein
MPSGYRSTAESEDAYIVGAERTIRPRIARLQERVKATAEPITPTERRIHTRVVNLPRIERRKLAAIEAGKPP